MSREVAPSLRRSCLCEEKVETESKKRLENVINSLLMIIVKTWLYCEVYNGMKDRINPALQ